MRISKLLKMERILSLLELEMVPFETTVKSLSKGTKASLFTKIWSLYPLADGKA